MWALILLCSCQALNLAPPTKSQQASQVFAVKQAADTPTVPGIPEAKTLYFDDQVTKQTLPVVDKTTNGKHFTLNMTTSVPDNMSIQVPVTGDFQLVIEAIGNELVILDNNALDGSAKVRLPAGLLEGFVQARGTPGQSMVLKDPLYHIEQELNRNPGKPDWHRIGKRQLPIPADWGNPDQALYLLNFKNQGVTNTSFRWYPSSGEPDYPVGLKWIGPEGGTVELPGVAKLVLPAGALSQKTLVRMSQELEVQEMFTYATHLGEMRLSYDFASPVVRIEPMHLKLNQKAFLYLNTNLERLGKNHAALLTTRCQQQKLRQGKINWATLSDREAQKLSTQDYHVNMGYTLEEFSICSKAIKKSITPDRNFQMLSVGPENSFQTQTETSERLIHFEIFFDLYTGATGFGRAYTRLQIQQWGDVLEQAYEAYQDLSNETDPATEASKPIRVRVDETDDELKGSPAYTHPYQETNVTGV